MANYNGQDPQTGAPGSTSPWSTWNFWQYSSTGSVPGVPSTNCDKDTFNGTATQLNSWIIMSAPTTPSPANNAQVTGSRLKKLAGIIRLLTCATVSGTGAIQTKGKL